MQGNYSSTRTDPRPTTSAFDMTADSLRAVEAAAALNLTADFEHEHSAPELQAAVASAVTHGARIKDVANAAHMTSLEVLDAADSLAYPGPPLRVTQRQIAEAAADESAIRSCRSRQDSPIDLHSVIARDSAT